MSAPTRPDTATVDWCDTLLIGGVAHRGAAGPVVVTDPATEEVLLEVPGAGETQVDAAVAAARQAFETISWRDPAVRMRAITALADSMEASSEELLRAVVHEVGTPITLARNLQIGEAVRMLRSFADRVDVDRSERLGVSGTERLSDGVITYQPVGVIAAITAYNYPLLFSAVKLGALMAAGCTAVVLPSPQAPLTTLMLGRLVRRLTESGDIPPGVINVLVGDAAVGRTLSEHPGVDKITFTGSVDVGRQIMAQAAGTITPVVLELGGKSPSILLPEVDAPALAEEVHSRYLRNAGQGCSSPTRILVPDGQYDDFVSASREALARIRTGDPWDSRTVAGPLISARHRERVEGFVDRAIRAGGTVVAGGGRPETDRGWYMNSTLVGGVANSAEIAQEELFGPVGVVLPYRTVEEAVQIANDSKYGLAATVYGDVTAARALAPRLRVGTVMVNGWVARTDKAAGGFKQSGIGREVGEAGVREFLATQFVGWPVD